MADAWDQFPDAPAQAAPPASADPWAQFPDAKQPAQMPAQPSFDQIRARVGEQMFPLLYPAGEAFTQAVTGVPAAIAGGLSGIAQGARNFVSERLNAYRAPDQQAPTGTPAADRVEQVSGALTYQPRTQGGQLVSRVVNLPQEIVAKGADIAGGAVSQATGSPALGAATNTAVQMAPALLFRGRGARVAGDVGGTPRPVRGSGPPAGGEPAAPPEAPTASQRPAGLAEVPPATQELKRAANAAYKRAEDAGLVLKPESIDTLKASITEDIQKSGGADPTLHPDTSAALRRIAEKPIKTLSDLDQARQIAKDAAGSIKPADRRLAQRIVNRIDEYATSLGPKDVTTGDLQAAIPALREGRDLWSRYRKSEIIDGAVKRAEVAAKTNYSQSGLENALRAQFRQLARNERTMRSFTPAEQEAIRRVAIGGPLENTLRYLGKFAPHGVVSSAVLGALGHATGGVGALAIAGGAELSRMAATRMTQANVTRASELVRRGSQTSEPTNALARPSGRNSLAPKKRIAP